MAYVSPFFFVTPFFIHDIQLAETIAYSLKGLVGITVLVLLINRVLGISFTAIHIIVLFIASLGAAIAFSNVYVPGIFNGDYSYVPGFAIWQGIIGGFA